MPRKRMQPSSARQLAIELLASAGEPLRAKELGEADRRVRPLLRLEGQDAGCDGLGDARRRLEAGRPLRACGQGHLRARRSGEPAAQADEPGKGTDDTYTRGQDQEEGEAVEQDGSLAAWSTKRERKSVSGLPLSFGQPDRVWAGLAKRDIN